jgi:hypothetical protein
MAVLASHGEPAMRKRDGSRGHVTTAGKKKGKNACSAPAPSLHMSPAPMKHPRHTLVAITPIVMLMLCTTAVRAAGPHSASSSVASLQPSAAPAVPLTKRVAAPPPARARATSVGLTRPVPDAMAAAKLNAVRQQVAKLTAKGKSPWVIMDIDDTLIRTVSFPKNAAVEGAVAYAKSLTQAGATIVYISGRKDQPAEYAKTVASLERLGFPLGSKGEIELNGMKLNTVLYKQEETNTLVKQLGQPVAVFDNEIANVRMFRSDLPAKVPVFRLDTASFSKDTGGKGTIIVIKNFDPQGNDRKPASTRTPAPSS